MSRGGSTTACRQSSTKRASTTFIAQVVFGKENSREADILRILEYYDVIYNLELRKTMLDRAIMTET